MSKYSHLHALSALVAPPMLSGNKRKQIEHLSLTALSHQNEHKKFLFESAFLSSQCVVFPPVTCDMHLAAILWDADLSYHMD